MHDTAGIFGIRFGGMLSEPYTQNPDPYDKCQETDETHIEYDHGTPPSIPTFYDESMIPPMRSSAQRLVLVAAENENNKQRTNNKTSHNYPANNPSP
jgi:hypothetical protein